MIHRAHRPPWCRQKPNRTVLRQIPIVFGISRSEVRQFISQEVPNYYILQHEAVVSGSRKDWTQPHVSPPAVWAEGRPVESCEWPDFKNTPTLTPWTPIHTRVADGTYSESHINRIHMYLEFILLSSSSSSPPPVSRNVYYVHADYTYMR